MWRLTPTVLLALSVVLCEDHCQKFEDCACKEYDSKAPSVLVWSTQGRLGNLMFMVKNLVESRVFYGMQVFIVRENRNALLTYFPNLANLVLGIASAEDELCGFEEFHKEVK